MRRVIIHAGFHKTGTTHLQQTLRANRAALRPDLRLVMRPGMLALCEAARAYSKSRSGVDLGLVKYEAAELAQTLEAQTVVLSSEDLSGHMPWRHGLRDYGAVPKLMAALAEAFALVAPAAKLHYLFTTRAAEPWLRSCYGQHLRAARMTMTEKEYLARFKRSADLDTILERVRAAVPAHPVTTARLEDLGARRLGPADAVFDLLALPDALRATLHAVPQTANTTPSQALRDGLLRLNRSSLSDTDLRRARRDMIESLR